MGCSPSLGAAGIGTGAVLTGLLTRLAPLEKTPPGFEDLPDVRDGLNRRERIVLHVLHQTQKERGGRNVPTAMLWGRVCEYFYISPGDLSEMLARLGARR